MSVKLNKNPTDRVCECSAILRWAGTPARGQYRHIRPDGQMYITTHAPAPRPSTDDRSEPTPAPQSGYTAFAVGDRVWLKNANGEPIMTGTTAMNRREVTFKVTSVTAGRYMLDTHNSEARRRYCGGIGYAAEHLIHSGA